MDSPTQGNRGLVAILGAASVLALAIGVVRWSSGVWPWSIAGLAATYAVTLPVHGGSLAESAGYGVGLFVVAELAQFSTEQVPAVRGRPGTVRVRVALTLAVVVVALLITDGAYGAAYVSAGGGLLLTVAVVAVVVVVGAVTGLSMIVRGRSRRQR